MTNTYDPKKYGKLLMEALPGVIETEEENERALEIVGELMARGEQHRSPEEDRLMSLIAQLIETYEANAYPLLEMPPAERLASLIKDNGLKQNDLRDVFGAQSIVSEVLNGKRQITMAQAKALAERFHLPLEVFV